MWLHISPLPAERLCTSASGSLLNSFPEKLYSVPTSWIKPKASPEASQPASRGLPHALAHSWAMFTNQTINPQGEGALEMWERASTDSLSLEGDWAFWMMICTEITPLFPRGSLPDTLPPSILWNHNPLLVTSQLLIELPTTVMSQDSTFVILGWGWGFRHNKGLEWNTVIELEFAFSCWFPW